MSAPARSTRIALAGATGRTGNAIAHGLAQHAGVELVACISPSAAAGTPRRPLPRDVEVASSAADVQAHYDVLVDVSVAEAVPAQLEAAVARGAHAVVGTTGVPDETLAELGDRFAAAGLGLLFAPNFAIGAVLMMRIARDVARLLPDVEIVETHHERKRDAPSGTAIRTARVVAAARQAAGVAPLAPGVQAADGGGAGEVARGMQVAGVPVHSLRLPGAVAHQEVAFGGPGELLTVRHDAIDRSCYASGVALAARSVTGFQGLVVGLEELL